MVEVVEHLGPGALAAVGPALLRALRPRIAVVTTPNVDTVPARVKFLLKGTVRMMDDKGDPSHISPIFIDLLRRHYLPRAGLRLDQHHQFPSHTWMYLPRLLVLAYHGIAAVLPGGPERWGDINIYVLKPTSGRA